MGANHMFAPVFVSGQSVVDRKSQEACREAGEVGTYRRRDRRTRRLLESAERKSLAQKRGRRYNLRAMKTYSSRLVRYPEMGISLDLSKLPPEEDFEREMAPAVQRAFAEMDALEGGAISNPDEERMVGHYWLRNSTLAPTPELRAKIDEPLLRLKAFAADILSGRITAPNGQPFTTCLVIGIGGSALGPELVADALPAHGLTMRFLDNTDPDGIRRVLATLPLDRTLVVVISKSGGTPETRNGMVLAQVFFREHGCVLARQAVAITVRCGFTDSNACSSAAKKPSSPSVSIMLCKGLPCCFCITRSVSQKS